MKTQITTTIALALLATSSAFAPSSIPRVNTAISAEKVKKELVLDTDFEKVNIVRLLGLRRLKKMSRKLKKQSNESK